MSGFELNSFNELNNNTIIIENYAVFTEISNELNGILNFFGKVKNNKNIEFHKYYCFNKQEIFKKIINLGNKLYRLFTKYNKNIEEVIYRNIINISYSKEIYSTIKRWLKVYGFPYMIDIKELEKYYKGIKNFEDTDIDVYCDIMQFVQDIIEIFVIYESLNKLRTINSILKEKIEDVGYELYDFDLLNQFQKIINIIKERIKTQISLNNNNQIREIIYINSKISFDFDLLDTETRITENNIEEKLEIYEKIIFSYLDNKINTDIDCSISYNKLILLEKNNCLKYFTANIYNSLISFAYNELKYILTNKKTCKNIKCNKLLDMNDKRLFCSEKCKKEGRRYTNKIYYAKNKSKSKKI